MSRLSSLSRLLPGRARKALAPLGVWVLMAVAGTLNGIFRETILIPRTGEYEGHVASTALLVTAILAISYAYFTSIETDYTKRESLLIGVTWTALTVGFEFLVGYVEATPVEETLGQYDVFAGQVWIIVPLTLLAAPLLFSSDPSE